MNLEHLLANTAGAVGWSTQELVATSNKLDVINMGWAIGQHWLQQTQESSPSFYLNLVLKDQLTARQLAIGLAQAMDSKTLVLNFLATGDGTGVAGATQTYDVLNEIGVHRGFDLTRGHPSLVAITFAPVSCREYLGQDGRLHRQLHVPIWSGEPSLVRETAQKYCEEGVAIATYFNQIWQLVRTCTDTDGVVDTDLLARQARDALENFSCDYSDDVGWELAGSPGLAYWVDDPGKYFLDPIIRQAAVFV